MKTEKAVSNLIDATLDILNADIEELKEHQTQINYCLDNLKAIDKFLK